MSEFNNKNFDHQNSIKKRFLSKLFPSIFGENNQEQEKNNKNNFNQSQNNFNEDDYEDAEDDDKDVIFINGKKKKKKNSAKKDEKVQKIIDDLINAKLDDYKANQQRNLDRETGGTEQPDTYITDPKDVWDNRYEEIQEMAEIDQQDYNSDDKASMIWENKRKKRKKEEELAKANFPAPVAISTASALGGKNKANTRNF